MIGRVLITLAALACLVPGPAPAQEPFPSAMDKIQVPPAYQDADEFRAWWDADATRLAEVIKKIGKVEVK
jgi:hypothetical protein